jgi:hypothetical protein
VYGLKGGWYGDGTFIKVCGENTWYTFSSLPSPDGSVTSKYYPYWYVCSDVALFGSRRVAEMNVGVIDDEHHSYVSNESTAGSTKTIDGKLRGDIGSCIFSDGSADAYVRTWYLL